MEHAVGKLRLDPENLWELTQRVSRRRSVHVLRLGLHSLPGVGLVTWTVHVQGIINV
jgi:hypothetical protein